MANPLLETSGSASTITPAPAAAASTPPGDESAPSRRDSWVVGPVVGSVLGVVTVLMVIYFTRRNLRLKALAALAAKEMREEDEAADDSCESMQAKSQLQEEPVEMTELEHRPIYELPAAEPVGSELNTPRDGTMDPIEEWPLPISPLPAMFALAEIRDERAGNNNSPKHDTYYNP
jgi:hypothetical protein